MARNSNTELVINGIKVDSVNEYNVATALTNLGFEFAYQYYFGQRSIRGSQIIDFLVYTTPKPTPRTRAFSKPAKPKPCAPTSLGPTPGTPSTKTAA